MAIIGMNIYALRAYDEKGKKATLNRITDNKSIIDVIKEFLIEKSGKITDDNLKEELYKVVDWEEVVQKDENDNEYQTYLYGRIKSGKYGVETEIFNKKGDLKYKQTPEEAGLKPFDFLVGLSKDDCDETIIVLQTVSGYGIKVLLERELNKYVSGKYNYSKILFSAIYPKQYLKKYFEKGIIKNIRLLRNRIPRDEADRYGVNQGKKSTKYEVKISSRDGFKEDIRNKIRECIDGKLSYDKVIETSYVDIDDVKIDVKVGGKDKIISLKNIDRAVVSEDITDKVKCIGGNPTKDTVISVLLENEIDYLIEMGNIVRIDNIKSNILTSIIDNRNE